MSVQLIAANTPTNTHKKQTMKIDKKKKDTPLNKRFNSEDVKNWQLKANEKTGGNLTLWMELVLNKAVKGR